MVAVWVEGRGKEVVDDGAVQAVAAEGSGVRSLYNLRGMKDSNTTA